MINLPRFKQLVLVVLDGFGIASASEGNAVVAAAPRNINYLINNFPATALQASGPSVGLPWGERGNSEVGHLNLGAGRIVSQDLPRINQAISQGEFAENDSFLAAISHVKKNNSRLHLVGLVSPGGVHSSEEHLYALLALADEHKLAPVLVHMFTDGRDTAPKSALESIERLSRKFLEVGVGQVATVTGRFYAMDRGGHWEVTEQTYKAMVLGRGASASSASEAVQQNYRQQIYDEMIPPTVISKNSQPVGLIREGDAVIFFNFRPDRTVQLTRSLADSSFNKFSEKYPYLQNMYYATMTLYDKNLPVSVAFPPQEISNGLSEVISQKQLSQFHIAESEKYAHVTSFFNGGRDAPWPLEERQIITSPAAYQKRYEDVPEMSAAKISANVVEKLKGSTSFILANFANADMVGHTGNKSACVRAVQALDQSLSGIFRAVMQRHAALVVTADHGNIEEVIEPRTGRVDKEHTLNPVPLILAGPNLQLKKPKVRGYEELPAVVPEGVLSDVSPTVLDLLGLDRPEEMTAISLLPLLLRQKQ